MNATKLNHEQLRLDTLHSFQILDTLPEKEFDDITMIVQEICNTPIALMTLISGERQWFKSAQGVDITETPRSISFCSVAIETPKKETIIGDLRTDVRFSENPFVCGAPNAVFYAGFPLVCSNGIALGTLCTLDYEPRVLSPTQVAAMKSLSDQVMDRLILRKKIIELEATQLKLQKANKELDHFAHVVSHDIKNPLRTMHGFSKLLHRSCKEKLEENDLEMLNHISDSALQLSKLVDGILSFSKSNTNNYKLAETIELEHTIKEIIQLLPKTDIKFDFDLEVNQVFTSKIGLQQILLNLLTNAVKFMDKKDGRITIKAKQIKNEYQFQVIDNGMGMKKENLDTIFQMMTTLDQKDQFGNYGTGIGLATVKNIIEKLDGEITVDSVLIQGTTFTFKLPKVCQQEQIYLKASA